MVGRRLALTAAAADSHDYTGTVQPSARRPTIHRTARPSGEGGNYFAARGDRLPGYLSAKAGTAAWASVSTCCGSIGVVITHAGRRSSG